MIITPYLQYFVAKLVLFSAVLCVPNAAASASLEAPSIALVASGKRVEDANKALCLSNTPSVAGVVCVDKEWRKVVNNTLNKIWLARIRTISVELLCAQIEELNDEQHTRIMSALKAQFLVRHTFYYVTTRTYSLQVAIGVESVKRYRWLMQRALRFSSTASLDNLSSLAAYLERVPSTRSSSKSRIFKHHSIFFVRADQHDDVRSLPLVVCAEQLGVETLLVDAADARHFVATTSFQDVPFEALTDEALDKIEERERGEPCEKKQKNESKGSATLSQKLGELLNFQDAQRVRRVRQ